MKAVVEKVTGKSEPVKQEMPGKLPDGLITMPFPVGDYAKGLLLRGDNTINMVLQCSEKPTLTILRKVAFEIKELIQILIFKMLFFNFNLSINF